MTIQNQLLQILRPEHLLKSLFQGAFTAFVLFSIFLVTSIIFSDVPRIGLWVMLPVLTVSLAGGFGGILYYITNHLWSEGWKKRIANVLSALIFIVLAYLSLIAALALLGFWN